MNNLAYFHEDQFWQDDSFFSPFSPKRSFGNFDNFTSSGNVVANASLATYEPVPTVLKMLTNRLYQNHCKDIPSFILLHEEKKQIGIRAKKLFFD